MKQIQFHGPGAPAEVVLCAETDELVIAAADDVLVAIEAFTINPADLLTLQGYYPKADPSSSTLGLEAVARVVTVGSAVEGLAPGDAVILLGPNNWSQRKVVKARDLMRVPASIDPLRLAGLKVNPATAHHLLTQFADLRPGDWVLQNAANSAVGRALIEIASELKLKTVNVVRRADVAGELEALGADVVLIDGDDLPSRVAEATHGAEIRLATDAVAGAATDRMAACLAAGGVLVVYGAASGEAAPINPGRLVFQDIVLRGFWLTRYLSTAPREDLERLYGGLCRMVERGALATRVDAVFDAADIKTAVERAAAGLGRGKVIVTFN